MLLLLALACPPLSARTLPLDRLDQPAPPLSLGGGRSLGDYQGQWVMLHFWATWCTPCVRELPALQRFEARSAGTFVLLTVAMDGDNRALVEAFQQQHGITLPVVLEQQATGHAPFTGWGLPATYFIAPNGYVVARALGPRGWDAVEPTALAGQLE
ncbi:MAG: TlpA family protein disulfide reductase [Pseudomonadales bacterium]|nr:TlpA family protein disulfide reductase [Pseudomonadales bacterium]MCP5182490.1 TlpA family protein disulfide reductase [Pseudomonadales bacterium]